MFLAASFDFKPGENFVGIRIAPEQAELWVTETARGIELRALDSCSGKAIGQRITKKLILAHGDMQISVFGCDQQADSSDALIISIKFAVNRDIDSMWSRMKKLA